MVYRKLWLSTVVVFFFSGCGEKGASINPEDVSYIVVKDTKVGLYPGESHRFEAVAFNSEGEELGIVNAEWESSAQGVVEVDGNGVARALSEGSAFVVARWKGFRSNPAEVVVRNNFDGEWEVIGEYKGIPPAYSLILNGTGYLFHYEWDPYDKNVNEVDIVLLNLYDMHDVRITGYIKVEGIDSKDLLFVTPAYDKRRERIYFISERTFYFDLSSLTFHEISIPVEGGGVLSFSYEESYLLPDVLLTYVPYKDSVMIVSSEGRNPPDSVNVFYEWDIEDNIARRVYPSGITDVPFEWGGWPYAVYQDKFKRIIYYGGYDGEKPFEGIYVWNLEENSISIIDTGEGFIPRDLVSSLYIDEKDTLYIFGGKREVIPQNVSWGDIEWEVDYFNDLWEVDFSANPDGEWRELIGHGVAPPENVDRFIFFDQKENSLILYVWSGYLPGEATVSAGGGFASYKIRRWNVERFYRFRFYE